MGLRQANRARRLLAIVLVAVGAAASAPAQEIPPALGHATSSPVPDDVAAPTPTAGVTPTPPPAAVEGMIERGAYLVKLGGCNDCHTPLKSGPKGAEPDMDRMLSGHPQDLKMPPPPALPPGPWATVASATNTAFAGPWGVSYASNLTPDSTGLGGWSEKTFVETMRTGKHRGSAREILPPMPWQNLARLTDDDLRSVHRYLTSIPAIANRVPDADPATSLAAQAAKP